VRPYLSSEVFSGNDSINGEIHDILQIFDEPSRSRVLKAMRKHRADLDAKGTEDADAAARHTFRELLVGRAFQKWGFDVHYEEPINGLSPDWLDLNSRLLVEVVTCERGGSSEPADRMGRQVQRKATRYKEIVRDHSLRFVVAIHGDFCSVAVVDDFRDAISEWQLFDGYSHVSGLLFFAETDIERVKNDDGSVVKRQRYGFHYFCNPHADQKLDLVT
jgi:hypothetical protein